MNSSMPDSVRSHSAIAAFMLLVCLMGKAAAQAVDVGDPASADRQGLIAEWREVNQPLEVAADSLPALDAGDFSIATWVQSDSRDGQASGDLISHYDPAARRGFQITLKSNSGVTSNQANWRRLQFGIDDDAISDWRDCGRPGNALFAFSMAEHAGELFVGTCEPGQDESGRVYRWSGGDGWQDCGAPDDSNSVTAMAEYEDQLLVATGRYRVAGSSLPESKNLTPGGRVFRYASDHQWIDCGQLPGVEAIGGMVVFRGKLYASSLYRPAGFFRYEGETNWTQLPVPLGQDDETNETSERRVVSLTVFDGFLYASSYDSGHVYRFDGDTWEDCGCVDENTQTYAFTSFQGRLHVATWPSGKVYRWEDPLWVDIGRLGDELEVMGMIVHNGRLMAGTLPSAQVYAYAPRENSWQLLKQLDDTPNVRYRRAWTMAECDGRLYCSTLPSGKVFSVSQGFQVSTGNALSSEWHHVAATRSSDRLCLWVDGKLVSSLADSSLSSCLVSSSEPWRICSGPNGPLNGRLKELRIYQRALTDDEIKQLATPLDRR
jgi:hypothetical protein